MPSKNSKVTGKFAIKKRKNSGNISMKNNGKDMPSLASTFTWNVKEMDSKK